MAVAWDDDTFLESANSKHTELYVGSVGLVPTFVGFPGTNIASPGRRTNREAGCARILPLRYPPYRAFEFGPFTAFWDCMLNRMRAMTPAKNRINDPEIKINPEAVASVHESGVVILDNSRGRLYSSGPAGAYIWRCIEQRLSVEAIAERLHADFQVELTTARDHTARFMEQLHGNGLIERRAA